MDILLALMFKDGEEIEIAINFSHLNNRFSIYPVDEEGNVRANSDYEYFHGTFELKEDKVYYTLLPKWQEMHGVKEIIFTKIAGEAGCQEDS